MKAQDTYADGGEASMLATLAPQALRDAVREVKLPHGPGPAGEDRRGRMRIGHSSIDGRLQEYLGRRYPDPSQWWPQIASPGGGCPSSPRCTPLEGSMSLFPLLRRPDGDPVNDESHVRRMMPYLMLGRNESAVYHEQNCDVTKARAWLRIYNQKHEQAATLFHLMLFAFARGFHERPGVNRFVNGRRIYQRKHVEFAFAVKKSMNDDAPLVTVKVRFGKDESFTTILNRVVQAIEDGRGPTQSITDKELALAMALPSPLLSLVVRLLRWLDRVNLLPGAMIDSDPMFCSAFVANLGSVGLDNTFHHLYEYGNASLFAVIGAPKRQHALDRRGKVEVRDTLQVRWTFDERINDGMYAGRAMRVIQRVVEDPTAHLGPPDADAADPTVVPAFPAAIP